MLLNEILEDEESLSLSLSSEFRCFYFPFRNNRLKKKKSAGFFMAKKTFCLTRRRTSVVH
jgi:hypothetical protein